MEQMLKHCRVFLLVSSILAVFACDRNQQHSHLTATKEAKDLETFEEAFEFLVRWTVEHNAECSFDFSAGIPPQASNPGCTEFWIAFNKFSGEFSQHCTELAREDAALATDPNEGRRIFFNKCFDLYKSVTQSVATKILATDGAGYLDRFTDAVAASDLGAEGTAKPASLFHLTYLRPFISKERVAHLLNTLEFPAGSVTYDGDTSRLVFTDAKLKADTDYLSMALRYAVEDVRELVPLLSDARKSFWTKDDNVIDGSSRAEPFDVLVVSVKNSLLSSAKSLGHGQLNTIEMGKVVAVAVKRLFDVTYQGSDDEIYLFRDPNRPISFKGIAVCASHKPLSLLKAEVRHKIYAQGNLVFLGSGQGLVQMIDMREIEGREFQAGAQLECGDKVYRYSSESTGGGVTIAKPAIESKKKIKAVITTALVKEMNYQTLAGALAYLQSKGYWLQPSWSNYYVPGIWEDIDDLKNDFLNEVNTANIFIPVSHNSSLDEVPLGTQKALKIRLNKNFIRADGSTADLELVFYTPPTTMQADNKIVSLFEWELKQVFAERHTRNAGSLFILSTSCFSEVTLETWMRAYRMYHTANPSGVVNEAPLVVGSKRGFATSSPIQILSHFEYPFGVLDGFGEGRSMEEIVGILAKPVKPTYQREILTWAERIYRVSGLQEEQRWESIWSATWKQAQTDFAESFDAVTNLETPYYWDGTARVDIIFTNVENPAEKYIF